MYNHLTCMGVEVLNAVNLDFCNLRKVLMHFIIRVILDIYCFEYVFKIFN